MSSDNIEEKVRKILETQGIDGWLRTNDCANLFAKGNATKKTTFYRWRKDIEKGRIKGFQIVQLPKNVSFIGLDSANPKALEELSKSEEKSKAGKEQPTPGEIAVRYFKWRGTPEGGGNRFFKQMFDDE